MSAEEIRAALQSQLAEIPQYPDDDTDAAVSEYDDRLNIALENLRDLCQTIVGPHETMPNAPALSAALAALEAAGEASLSEDAPRTASHLSAALAALAGAGEAEGLARAAVAFVTRYPDLVRTMGGEMIEDAHAAVLSALHATA